MNIAPEHLTKIQSYGYTRTEAGEESHRLATAEEIRSVGHAPNPTHEPDGGLSAA